MVVYHLETIAVFPAVAILVIITVDPALSDFKMVIMATVHQLEVSEVYFIWVCDFILLCFLNRKSNHCQLISTIEKVVLLPIKGCKIG
jgi:hypothetical protein